MITHANFGTPVERDMATTLVTEDRTSATLRFCCMASLVACAFSAASAIQLGSLTHPFTFSRADREHYGAIRNLHGDTRMSTPSQARIDCISDVCQSLGGPIARIVHAVGLSTLASANSNGPGAAQPSAAPNTTSLATAEADDDGVMPPLPSTGVSTGAATIASTDVTPLPAQTRHRGIPHYVEVTPPDDRVPIAMTDPFPGASPHPAANGLDSGSPNGPAATSLHADALRYIPQPLAGTSGIERVATAGGSLTSGAPAWLTQSQHAAVVAFWVRP